jgi:hypothetical protein
MSPKHERAQDREGVEYGGTAPTVEVVVYRDGEVIHRELCESTDAAADVVDQWSEVEGVECAVDDLSIHHRMGQILEPAPEESLDDDAFPHVPRAEPEG